MNELSENTRNICDQKDDYMLGFDAIQTGQLGDFTTGKDGNSYADYFYFEWYSNSNGRVVYEGSPDEVEIIEPMIFDIPENHRETQQNQLFGFMSGIAKSFSKSSDRDI